MKAHSSAPASAAALLLLVALAGASDCGRTLPSSPSSAAAFVGRRRGHSLRSSSAGDAILARGGAAALDEYDSDLDVGADEYDSEEEEEAIRVIPKKLKKSTVRAAKKAGSKKSAASKRAIGATLYETKPKKRKASLAKVLRIPYIVRACLNPITCFVMMRAYLASLFNIDYLVEVRGPHPPAPPPAVRSFSRKTSGLIYSELVPTPLPHSPVSLASSTLLSPSTPRSLCTSLGVFPVAPIRP